MSSCRGPRHTRTDNYERKSLRSQLKRSLVIVSDLRPSCYSRETRRDTSLGLAVYTRSCQQHSAGHGRMVCWAQRFRGCGFESCHFSMWYHVPMSLKSAAKSSIADWYRPTRVELERLNFAESCPVLSVQANQSRYRWTTVSNCPRSWYQSSHESVHPKYIKPSLVFAHTPAYLLLHTHTVLPTGEQSDTESSNYCLYSECSGYETFV